MNFLLFYYYCYYILFKYIHIYINTNLFAVVVLLFIVTALYIDL